MISKVMNQGTYVAMQRSENCNARPNKAPIVLRARAESHHAVGKGPTHIWKHAPLLRRWKVPKPRSHHQKIGALSVDGGRPLLGTTSEEDITW